MVRQFDSARLSLHATRAHAKSSGLKLFFVLFVNAVVAVVLLGAVFTAADGMEPASRCNFQALVTRCFGAAFSTIRQTTGKWCDDVVRRAGAVLRAVCVADFQNISRILYQSILESPSSSGERPVSGSSKLDAAQHSRETLVRTPGAGD